MSGFAEYVNSPTHLARADALVRVALADDLPAMAEVQRSAGRAMHLESLGAAIESPGRCVLVAQLPTGEERGIVGWAQTWWHGEVRDAAPVGHYLAGVTVAPAHRRRGIADALTSARMRWIAQRADEAFYVVNPQNRASIALHRRWGFKEVLRADVLTGVTFDGGIGLLMRAPTRGRVPDAGDRVSVTDR